MNNATGSLSNRVCSRARSGSPRRRLVLLLALLIGVVAGPTALFAQERGEPRVGRLPSDVISAVLEGWNGAGTRQVRGRFVVAPGDTIATTLAVLDGPLVVSGTVLGDVIVINGDVRLDSSAVVRGAVRVVGGVVVGRTRGQVDGEMQAWRSKLSYREADGVLTADEDASIFSQYAQWRLGALPDLRDVLVTSAHTYNRVEGLAILAGPRLRFTRGASRTSLEAFGIFRTGDRLALERENFGHRLRAEFREGSEARYLAFGAEHIDEVSAVESWTVSGAETGLTSLLFGRDYRDYWNREGGSLFARMGGANRSVLTLRFAREQWKSREAQNPLAFFQGDRTWRANPAVVEGDAMLVGFDAVLDTRNDPERPRDGWFLQGSYEHGQVDVTRPVDETSFALTVPEFSYGRGFVDIRRYNRISPHASVNVRLVAGGLLHGDALPPQRQLSVSGVGALPGYAFRGLTGDVDVGTCNVLPEEEFSARGRPAGCDRILLLQAEWKGDFRISLFGAERRTDDQRWYADGLRADGTWVVFVNSGRGWLVGPQDNGLSYPRGVIPLYEGFRTDAGVGLDFGDLGVYVAEPLQGSRRVPRVFVRLSSRF